jgi:hypothetical protein
MFRVEMCGDGKVDINRDRDEPIESMEGECLNRT